MGRLADAWNDYWYGAVAPVRPLLLGKILLVVLAFDLWMLRLGGAARYGIDGFNVAHFVWLDAFAPVPTAQTYVAVVMLTGFLALWVAVGGMGRLTLLAVLLLYTYSWSISRLDSYQHHYLFSLLLVARLFFPETRVRDLFPGPGDTPATKVNDDRQASAGQAAWAYRLFGVSVAIVYLYAAVAKLDQQWLSGHTLRRILEPESDSLLWTIIRGLGISPATTLVPMALGAILLELALAAGYVSSPRFDRSRAGAATRYAGWAAWLSALALHLGIETANFSIGWFSAYMILTASVFFLPVWLLRAPCRWLLATWDRIGIRRPGDHALRLTDGPGTRGGRRAAGAFVVVLCGVIAVVLGRQTDLPGAAVAGGVVAVLIAISAAAPLLQGRGTVFVRRVVSGTVCCITMWLAIISSSARFNFYWDLGRTDWALGRSENARIALRKAERYLPSRDAKACIDLGSVLLSSGQVDRAAALFRRAKRLQPHDTAAHVHLGLASGYQQKLDEAVDHFRDALEINPDNVTARSNLGAALLRLGRQREAIVQYRTAVAAAPRRIDVRTDLARALAAAGQWEDAIGHYRHVLAVRPDDPRLHLEMARALEARGRMRDALGHYQQALRIANATRQKALASRIRSRIESVEKRHGRDMAK